jgi:hypothetical protein
MKNRAFILAAVVAASLASGCKQPDQANENPTPRNTDNMTATQQLQSAGDGTSNAWDSTKAAATNAWADVKAGGSNAWVKTKEVTTNAWDAVKNELQSNPGTNYSGYVYDEKDALVSQAGADLHALDQKISEMSDQAASAGDSVKADAHAKLRELREQRAALDQKLEAVKNSSEADWNDTKAAFQAAYTDFDHAVDRAWHWLNDKSNS